MAWNEPGNGQDPWGGGNRGGGNNGGGPPDLDEIWRRIRSRFAGGGGGSGSSGGASGGPPPKLLLALIPVILVIWLITGFYVVQPGAKGVLLNFGEYEKTAGPGLHWHWPYPIAWVISVDTQKVRSAQTSGLLLTKDQNIVDVRVSMQYRVTEARDYLFNVRNPEQTVELALRSAVREIVSTSRMNQVIQEGVQPSDIQQAALENVDLKKNEQGLDEKEDALSLIEPALRAKIKAQKKQYPDIERRSRAMLPENITGILQAILHDYQIGIKVTAVNVQYAQPPEPVQPAFEAAIMAREEMARKKNLARAYARKVVARAKGKAAQKVLQARGYRESKIARAQGEVDRFLALLQAYSKAPDVTRTRLYLESLGNVLGDSNLILLGSDKGTPLMYMPLQKMLGLKASDQSASSGNAGDSDGSDPYTSLDHAQSGTQNPLRSRERGR